MKFSSARCGFVLMGLCVIPSAFGATAYAQTAPSTYSAYTGTDNQVIPPAPPLGAANTVITDPTFGSHILRVTDQNTKGGESFISTDSGFHRAWNANSTAIKLEGPHGDGYWLEFNPSTFTVGDGSPTPALHPLPFGAKWEWSAIDPDVIYFLQGNQIAEYNKSTGLTTNLGGPPNGDSVMYMAVVIGMDNWVCAAAGSGIQDSYVEIYCLNPINPSVNTFINVLDKTINGTASADPNWPTSASGQTLGIHDISGGTGPSWLEVTFHGQSWGANGGAVLDLATNTWSEVTKGDYYWSGHVSMGYGKYTNSAGSINGDDSRGMLLRDPDNLMNSGEYQFISQPPNSLNQWCDADHNSWLNSTTNPSAPILTSRYTIVLPCQFAWAAEIDAAATDGSNTVWRFAHNHNGGNVCYFAEAFAQISNDGHWALFSSYWDGTLGPDTAFGCSTRIDTFIVDLFSASPNLPLTIPPLSLPAATQGVSYIASLSASGGVAPYTWSVTSGTLPAGLSLSTSGTISGTPTGTGTTTVTVQVLDAKAVTATAALNLTVDAPMLAMTTGLLPNGTQNTPYSVTLAATGGTPPYTWSIISGALPAALVLDSSSGLMSGTPSASGTSSFTVQVADANALKASASLTLTINALPATFTRVEENDPSITYTGGWYTVNNLVLSGGSAVQALDSGSSATFTFTGTVARWIGFTDPWSGIANVFVDDVLQGPIDEYSSTQQAQVILYTTPTLSPGTHTVMIQSTYTRNPSAQSAWVWVDAFETNGTAGGTGQLPAQSGILQGDLFLTAEKEKNETNRNHN